MSYPKWVQRAPHIGAVLCQSEDEEKQVLGDWKAEQEARAKKAESVGEVEAEEAEEESKVVLSKHKHK